MAEQLVTLTLTKNQARYLRMLLCMPYTCARLAVPPGMPDARKEVEDAQGAFMCLCYDLDKELEQLGQPKDRR